MERLTIPNINNPENQPDPLFLKRIQDQVDDFVIQCQVMRKLGYELQGLSEKRDHWVYKFKKDKRK